MAAKTPNLAVLDLDGPLSPTRGPFPLQVLQEPPAERLTEREQELTNKMICLLVANGESYEQAGKKLNIPADQVRAVVSQPRWMDMVVRFQADASNTPQERVRKMGSIALDVQTRLMLAPGTADAVRAKVAQDVADRAMGKAIQTVETRNLHFDLKDAAAVDKALKASEEKLARIEALKKSLALPVGSIDT